MSVRLLVRRIVYVSCALLVASCAASPGLEFFEYQGRAWPEAPEVERIVFVGEFSDARDLSIRESVWGEFVNIIAGKSQFTQIRPMAVTATV